MSEVDFTFACAGIVIAMGIALLFPNLYDMTRDYQTALVSPRQCNISRIGPAMLPVKYYLSVRWCIILGIIAAVAIISIQTTSEFLYFQF